MQKVNVAKALNAAEVDYRKRGLWSFMPLLTIYEGVWILRVRGLLVMLNISGLRIDIAIY